MSHYNPSELVKDGPFFAARKWHHVLKALIAVTIYAGFRDGLHFAPWLAAVLASPVALTLIAVKEWNRPSDPNEWGYSRQKRAADFATDFACTAPAVMLALASSDHWMLALSTALVATALYLAFRRNARP